KLKDFSRTIKYQLIGILLQITIQFHYYAQSMKIKV
ncbi:hypothetical protein M111_1142, partial [Bacteroides fragilis str. 3986T(B)10]